METGTSAFGRLSKSVLGRLNQQDEQEKKALAHLLHDRVATAISDLKLQTDLAFEKIGCVETDKTLAEIRSAFDRILESTRMAIAELRPPILDELGLADALSWYRRMISKQSSMTINLKLGPEVEDIEEPWITEIFRLFQLFCKDLAREAQADTLHFALNSTSESIHLEYRDDGLDISSLGEHAWDMPQLAKIHMKALSLGGTMILQQARGKGNRVSVSIPLNAQAPGPFSGDPA